ncbi:molybdenum cofactor biosynthesis protein B [Halobacterium salinarum]|uniref:MogA/MoaB family molybdenum cofactor biosynthesis protein n=1 Tax=Halobacterium salinarum TaxID=2242 RepID=UPI001F303970|nr:molybdopterin-binding protein [Halobacterium salinarum]MCF2207070.1 molybdenum cofactor biosynthesis protein B [Halobacterium salinarum]
MVDFQSRNTRRNDDDDDDAAERSDDGTAESTPDDEDSTDAHHDDDVSQVGVAVVTVSSSRSLSDDPAGDAVVAAVEAAGHEVATRELVTDRYDRVQGALDNLTGRDDVAAVVTTGGTGVTPDDVTVDAARPLFDMELPGFGEEFRRRSAADIGTKIIGSRATGGVVGGTLVFCLPGSEHAATLGTDEIILPELAHLAGLAGHNTDA